MLPISDSTYLHLWMGVAPAPTGGPMDEGPAVAEAGASQELVNEPDQAKRYRSLARDVALGGR